MQIYYTDIKVDDGNGGKLTYVFGYYSSTAGETKPTNLPLAEGSTITDIDTKSTYIWKASSKTWA